jgi:hypothetical protein
MLEFQLPAGLLNGDPPSWYATIGSDASWPEHFDGTRRAAALGSAVRVVILEPGGELDVFVSEYAETLGYIMDRWFPTRESAIQDYDQMFGDQLGSRHAIPEAESHPEGYVLRALASQQP